MQVTAIRKGQHRKFSVETWNTGMPAKMGWVKINTDIKTPPEAVAAVAAKKTIPLEKMTPVQLMKHIDDNGLDPALKELPKSEIIEKLSK